MAKQDYNPNWLTIDTALNAVAVDKGGDVYAYDTKPEAALERDEWLKTGNWAIRIDEVHPTPKPPWPQSRQQWEDWQEMVYERPKNL